MLINTSSSEFLGNIPSFVESQQIAASNFILFLLGVMVVFIPSLMIARGSRIEQNRAVLFSLINPFYKTHISEEIVLGLNAEERAKMNMEEENLYEIEMFGWSIN